jgi:hypothetical protein
VQRTRTRSCSRRALGDGFDDIITGRRPFSDYDGLIGRGWSNGENAEYQQAYTAAQEA